MARKKQIAKKARRKSRRLLLPDIVLPTPPTLPFKVHLHAPPVCQGRRHHVLCTPFGPEVLCRSKRVGSMRLAVCTHRER